MSFFEGAYAIWLRELKTYVREKERIISGLISPLIWLLGFGFGLGSSVSVSGTRYDQFIFPGILTMTVLFASMFYGIYILWDRKQDYLKAVLVAPISRSALFTGKLIGGVSEAMVEAVLLLIIGYFLGFQPTLAGAILALLVLTLISVCMTALGLLVGAKLSTPEGFQLVISILIWPLFIFSGALFPLSNLPSWLSLLTQLNPLTYGVDAVRGALIGQAAFPLYIDIAALLVFAAAVIYAGILSFGDLQQEK
jgi:ABC-2 type transport system permease protein